MRTSSNRDSYDMERNAIQSSTVVQRISPGILVLRLTTMLTYIDV